MWPLSHKHQIAFWLAVVFGIANAFTPLAEGYEAFSGLDAAIVGWACAAWFFVGWLMFDTAFNAVWARVMNRDIRLWVGGSVGLLLAVYFTLGNIAVPRLVRSWYGHITYLEAGKVEAHHAP